MGRSRVLAAVPHLPAQLPACALLILAADRLSDPLASHFTAGGAPDGFTGRGTLLAVLLGLALSCAVLFGALAGSASGSSLTGHDGRRTAVGVSWGVAVLLGVLSWGVAAANLDLSDAADATLPLWWVAVGLGGGAVTGVVAHHLTRPGPTAAAPGPVPAMELGDTERVSWTRVVVSRPLAALGAVLTVVGAALALAGASPVAPIALVGASVLVAAASTARVTVDRRGLRVGLGPFGWPRIVVPSAEIVSATAADVSPAEFGGWGYRIAPGASAVILRSGPALVVTRRSGRRLAVTVDDPVTAAGLLNGISAC